MASLSCEVIRKTIFEECATVSILPSCSEVSHLAPDL